MKNRYGHKEPDHRKHKDDKIQSEQFAHSDNPGGKLYGDSNDGGEKKKIEAEIEEVDRKARFTPELQK